MGGREQEYMSEMTLITGLTTLKTVWVHLQIRSNLITKVKRRKTSRQECLQMSRSILRQNKTILLMRKYSCQSRVKMLNY